MITSTATETVKVVQEVAASHGGSMFSFFSQATLVVKLVMIVLVTASCWSWALIFSKAILIRKLSKNAKSFKKAFWSQRSLDEIYTIFSKDEGPFPNLFCKVMQEHALILKSVSSYRNDLNAFASIYKERICRIVEICISRESAYLENRLSFLASIGSVSPFVGLFGTVWGIMNSFESIGLEKNASLLSVAPGIAEALFATALGLVVAIPAVFAYNKISSEISAYIDDLGLFANELTLILQKKLEDKGQ